MITYATPEFAGVKVYAQYSFGENTDAKEGIYEGKSSTDRYYALGANMKMGGLNAILIVDSINNASWDGLKNESKGDVDDTVRVTLGGSYDFGVVKPYLAVGYFKDGSITDMGGLYDEDFDIGVGEMNSGDVMSYMYFDGFAVAVGADAPLFGGTIHGMVGYLDADSDRDVTGSYDGDKIDFEFKWVDNMKPKDEGVFNASLFYTCGDAAPGARFNFIYTVK